MKQRSQKIKPGARVAWNTPQGQTIGRVEKKITGQTEVKAHKISASKQNPEYLVRSGKSGKKAVHKATALKNL